MARGTQLGQLVSKLRAEARQAQEPALGQNYRATLVQTLQRTQERLWQEWPWPFLRVTRDKNLQAGERLYALPEDLPFERIIRLQRKESGVWCPGGDEGSIEYGVGGDEYSIYDSEADVRADPVMRWELRDDNQFEVWPIPATNATTTNNILRFTGIRNLKPLVADDDVAELDDNLIVLYAAAEILAAGGKKDAQAKLEQAATLFQRLKGAKPNRGRSFVFGGSVDDDGGRFSRPRVIVPVWRSH